MSECRQVLDRPKLGNECLSLCRRCRDFYGDRNILKGKTIQSTEEDRKCLSVGCHNTSVKGVNFCLPCCMDNTKLKKGEGKTRWTALPFKQVEEVVKVLMFGDAKYSPGNWKTLNPEPYKDAAMRHLISYISGDKKDSESGFSHLAHLICCALFMMWFDDNDGTKT